MLRELKVKKLDKLVYIEVKAKNFEDGYKELCYMVEYIVHYSFDMSLEELDIDGRFGAYFSASGIQVLDDVVKKAGKYADENGLDWVYEEKDGSIRYEGY